MVYLLVADNRAFRAEKVADIVARCEESELITLDDTSMQLPDLEQFLFPSLFSLEVPIVLARFLLAGEEHQMPFIKKLVASPTIFVFEEIDLPAPAIALFKKAGALVHAKEKQKSNKPAKDLFAVAKCLTEKDKKSRWLAYRAAVEEQPIEAIIGILYWKARSLAAKGAAGNEYEKIYRELLLAQAKAWKSGAPLEALIEKVILK